MPRTGLNTTPDLVLQMDYLQPSYLPGDTLTGIVSEHFTKRQNCLVQLKLFGRAKTKIKRSNGQSTRIYRGRAVFLEVEQLLFRGTLQGNEHQGWPFSITIPCAPTPGISPNGDEWKPETGFLSTQDDPTNHPLPGVYYYNPDTWGTPNEAFVEYILIASATDQFGGKSVRHTIPLFIRSPSTATPITDHKFFSQQLYEIVKTPRLLPEQADQPLTFRQKRRMFFHPSQTPKYAYTIYFDHPTVIQLDHPEPVPFQISVCPDLDPERTSICPDGDLSALPEVILRSISLKLRALVRIRCQSSFSTTESGKDRDYDLTFRCKLRDQVIPIVNRNPSQQSGFYDQAPQAIWNTYTPDPTLEDDSSLFKHTSTACPPPSYSSLYPSSAASRPLDLAPVLCLRVHPTGTSVGKINIPFPDIAPLPLAPSFQTCNISLSYKLDYKLTTVCAGEEFTHHKQTPITVLGASEDVVRQQIQVLGTQGMQQNYDDLNAAISAGTNVVTQVLGVFS